MPKSKFFRVATEGATTDGRNITRTWIEQAAKNYNQAKYAARINLEHFRSIYPDSPFRMYGDVTAVEARDVEDGKKALFAQMDPTPDLIALNKARQKLFTSIELDPNFADTGEAYLVGMAVTDSPASLGCEMLQFSAGAGDASPIANRKQKPENLFTAAVEFSLELEEETPGLLDKVKALFSKQKEETHADFTEHTKAIELIASEVAEVKTAQESFTAQIDTEVQKQLAPLQEALDKISADFSALKEQLASEDPNASRPAATGGNGRVRTDC